MYLDFPLFQERLNSSARAMLVWEVLGRYNSQLAIAEIEGAKVV